MSQILDDTVARTPNLDCPACSKYRQHAPEEWKQFHPLSGTGKFSDVEVSKKA